MSSTGSGSAVVDLREVRADMGDLVGGKAANLGELAAAGERVPTGFCVTTGAYDSGEVPRRRSSPRTSAWVAGTSRCVPARPPRCGCRGCRRAPGMREYAKFAWLVPFAEMRRQLVLAGQDLAVSGVLEQADDIAFLEIAEGARGRAGRRGLPRAGRRAPTRA